MLLLATMMALPHICEAQQTNNRQQLSAEWRDGDYIVRRYIVKDDTLHKAMYELHYAINSTATAPEYEHNDIELERLDRFFATLKKDTLRHISSITIMGYASPDGTTPFNATLARERAQRLSQMLTERYGLKGYNLAIDSRVEPWSATTEAINDSKLKNRSDIVKIVNTNEAPMVVDNKLKHDKAAWQWMKSDVLPDMRRAVVTIAYTQDELRDSREYSPEVREVIVVEEVIDDGKHHDKRHHGDKNKDKDKNHSKHKKRKERVISEWEGIIIDYGAAYEGRGRE